MLSHLVNLQINLDLLLQIFFDVIGDEFGKMEVPDLHILMTSFTSCLAGSKCSMDFKRSSR